MLEFSVIGTGLCEKPGPPSMLIGEVSLHYWHGVYETPGMPLISIGPLPKSTALTKLLSVPYPARDQLPIEHHLVDFPSS